MIFMLIPISVSTMNQDSLTIFKEKNLLEQHNYLKEHVYSLQNIETYIAAFLEKAIKEKDTHYIVKSYYFKYRIHRKSRAYIKAHSAIDNAILLAKQSKKDSLLGSLFHAKGATYFIQSNYTDALHYYLKADDIMLTKSSFENRLPLQFDIATIKAKGRNTKETLAEFERITHAYDSLLMLKPDSRFLKVRFVKMLNSTAKWYTEEAMYSKAIELYSKSLLVSETANYLSGKCTAIGGKGNVYTAEKKYNEAISKLDEALEISTKNSGLHLIMPFLLLDKGKCLFGLKKYDEALQNFNKTDSIIKAKDLKFIDLDETYQFLAKTHVKLGNHETAAEVYDQYIERKNLNADKRFELYQTIFKGYDLKNVEHRANEAKANSNLFKKYFIQTIVVTLLLAFIAIIFFVRYRNTQKQKLKKFHTLIQDLTTKEIKTIETVSTGYVLSDEKASKILDNLTALEAKLFFLDKKYNLTTLAKKCNTNSSYLSKVINQYKEKSFSEYITDMRITYVLSALKNDKKLRSYTIQSIAEEIGFKKSESFSKAFKKRTGFNPSFYIKNLENM
ncbi:tetratricopeptide repeat protein [uncultured Kordia sp.]|uniref:tetratricopeptide repeat protein n=1 Tax=uncultured Kordia sp. TaxID=507699 RepID=UPI00260564B9|nr:tetratricopeptide repeat protein [uncultured Kordia sp.]